MTREETEPLTLALPMNLSLNERTLALTPTLSPRERESRCSSAQVHGFKARRSALRGILSLQNGRGK